MPVIVQGTLKPDGTLELAQKQICRPVKSWGPRAE
jgi:hypothetical protein